MLHLHRCARAGVKQYLGTYRRYLVVMTNDTHDDGVATSTINLVDVSNRLIAGAFTLQSVRHVVCAPGMLAAATSAGALVCFQEIDLSIQVMPCLM